MHISEILKNLKPGDSLIVTHNVYIKESNGNIVQNIITDEGYVEINQIYTISSEPPAGNCRITNIYWDPVAKKAVFEYDDTPV